MIQQGIPFRLFWTDGFERGYFVVEVGNVCLIMNPWVGVELYETRNRNWTRADVSEYQPNDLLQYLDKVEGQ